MGKDMLSGCYKSLKNAVLLIDRNEDDFYKKKWVHSILLEYTLFLSEVNTETNEDGTEYVYLEDEQYTAYKNIINKIRNPEYTTKYYEQYDEMDDEETEEKDNGGDSKNNGTV